MQRATWILAALLGTALSAVGSARELLLATTTSVQDSGLLDVLLPRFSEETGIRVRVVAVGSGAALRMGAAGQVDALLTHAPSGEQALVTSGALGSRTPFMENTFVIAGPPDDPADVAGAASAVDAARRLAAADSAWVSRDDDSGTHRRERALLSGAGLDPEVGWSGFVRTGSGMGLALQVAGERQAYILSDLGTFLAFRERTGLVALFSRADDVLRNVYSYSRVSSDRFPKVRDREARELERYLLRPATLQRIGVFGAERFGRPLFVPLDFGSEAP